MKSDGYLRLLATMLPVVILAVLLAGCTGTDVVAKYAGSSFMTMATAMDASMNDGFYTVKSPAGDVFKLAADYSGATDALVSIDAAPFTAAGLDPARLPSGQNSSWTLEDGRLVGRFDLVADGKSSSNEPKAIVSAIVAGARSRIGYHAQLGHYGIMLDDYAMVEWAADAKKNDKDWVFVLDPKLIADAGGNYEALEGWILAMVPVDGPDGQMIEVQKLLRPLDIVP